MLITPFLIALATAASASPCAKREQTWVAGAGNDADALGKSHMEPSGHLHRDDREGARRMLHVPAPILTT